MITYIDMENYPRKSHFEYFGSLAYPYVGFTANVDVTNPIRFAKEKGGSSFLAILYVTIKAANAVPQLRQRVVDGRIVEFDYCNAGYTVALPDNTFCNCYTESRMSIEEFFVDAKARQQEAMQHPGFVNPDEDETGLFFCSCSEQSSGNIPLNTLSYSFILDIISDLGPPINHLSIFSERKHRPGGLQSIPILQLGSLVG
jgi:chloramphenicol O-acetyltransferase